jgi:hypothetical protein
MALLKHYLAMRTITERGCWHVPLVPSGDGYVYASVGGRAGKKIPLHRYAYEELVGSIDGGADLDHLCRNRACWNPAHAEPVTRRENLRRGETTTSLSDRNVCKRGHVLGGDNVILNRRDGRRQCKECANELRRVRRHAAKGVA